MGRIKDMIRKKLNCKTPEKPSVPGVASAVKVGGTFEITATIRRADGSIKEQTVEKRDMKTGKVEEKRII